MSIKFLKHRWQKGLLILSLVTISIVLILAFLVNIYWSPILSGKVKNVILNSSDSLYSVDFSRADLHILRGEIDIYDIVLKPDTAIYNRKKAAHVAPNNLFELHVKHLVLSHVHPFQLYFRRELNISKIVLNEPELKVSYQLNHTKDTVIKDRRTIYQRISKTLRFAHIGKILLNDVKLKYEDYSGNKVAISELKEMNLTATDLLIDSVSKNDKSRFFYCKDIVTELNNYSGHTAGGLYTYKIASLRLSTRTSKLSVRGLDLQPLRADVFFDKSMHDRFKFHLDSAQLSHFDFLAYHKYRRLRASSLSLNNGGLNVFNRPNKPHTDLDKIKTFPNFALQQLNDDITIDTIRVNHINIGYTEFNYKSNKTGTITFNNTQGYFLNVTNNKKALQKNNTCNVKLSSYFMNTGKLNVAFAFNLTDKNSAFSYSGSLGPMNLQRVNPATIPFALVKISSGKLTGLNFNINASSTVSKGRLTLAYTDLKVTLLQADTVNNQLKHKTLASLLVNALLINRSNPKNEGEQPKSFAVTYSRPKDYPFFKTIWHTLLEGIKPSIGLDDKKQKEVKNRFGDPKKKKQERMMKREQRKQRKAARKMKKELKKQQEAKKPL